MNHLSSLTGSSLDVPHQMRLVCGLHRYDRGNNVSLIDILHVFQALVEYCAVKSLDRFCGRIQIAEKSLEFGAGFELVDSALCKCNCDLHGLYRSWLHFYCFFISQLYGILYKNEIPITCLKKPVVCQVILGQG